MKKSYNGFENYIMSVIDKFVPVLLLQKHTFAVKRKDMVALMECSFNYPYLNPQVRYSEDAFKRWCKGEDMKPYIVHEMCHVITDPLYSKAIQRYCTKSEIEDERERLTDVICNIAIQKV